MTLTTDKNQYDHIHPGEEEPARMGKAADCDRRRCRSGTGRQGAACECFRGAAAGRRLAASGYLPRLPERGRRPDDLPFSRLGDIQHR